MKFLEAGVLGICNDGQDVGLLDGYASDEYSMASEGLLCEWLTKKFGNATAVESDFTWAVTYGRRHTGERGRAMRGDAMTLDSVIRAQK